MTIFKENLPIFKFAVREDLNKENLPIFKFAVREDLKDCDISFLPERAEPYATGWDVKAAPKDRLPIIIEPGQYFKIPLGFRAFPPDGWWLQLFPRSSSLTKKHMHNLIGIIDEHYSLEILFAGQYCPDPVFRPPLKIQFGEAIGQIIPVKREIIITQNIGNEEFDDLCSARQSVRNGGFGSTS